MCIVLRTCTATAATAGPLITGASVMFKVLCENVFSDYIIIFNYIIIYLSNIYIYLKYYLNINTYIISLQLF